MATPKSEGALDNWMEATVLEIKASLEAKKKAVVEEIVTYPPPIPACDAQFNYLLEERTRLTQELSRLEALTGENLPATAQRHLVEKFIDASPDLDAEMKQHLRAAWQEAGV